MTKIALEEHFVFPDFISYLSEAMPHVTHESYGRLIEQLSHLAMQDPRAAADELERCVHDLGFVGSMINGHTNGVYLDDPRGTIRFGSACRRSTYRSIFTPTTRL
jgi:predicted TIM-barrel fold metal-dependent hydrolase